MFSELRGPKVIVNGKQTAFTGSNQMVRLSIFNCFNSLGLWIFTPND